MRATLTKTVRRAVLAVSEVLYTQRRQVFSMLRQLGMPRRDAARICLFKYQLHRDYLRDSGVRLMLYRQHRDPFDRFGECYFGTNFLPRPLECVVDVGAHKGSFARASYALLRPRNLVCFEPNAALAQQLESMAAHMPNCRLTVRRAAIGERQTTINFRSYENPLLNSALELDQALVPSYASPMVEVNRVAQTTLDEELDHHALIDYLKIDTQGYELSVLSGARRTLRKTRVVLIECNFVPLYKDGSTFSKVHEFLTEAGFILVQLDSPSRSQGFMMWTDALYVSRTVMQSGATEIAATATHSL